MNSSHLATRPKNRASIIAFFVSALFVASVADRALADCAPSASGLVAWWSGDSNAQSLIGTNHGTLQGGATAGSPGFVSGAFNFDGTNGFVSIPDSPALRPTNFTIEAWVKVDAMNTPSTANAGVQFYVFKQNSRASFFEGYWLGKSRSTGTDTFIFGISSAAGAFVAARSTTIQTGVWYHLAAVRGSNYIQLYTNGVLSAQATVTFPQDYGNQPLYFGSSGVPSYDSKLKGDLDEVALYNRPLSSNEIAANYSTGADGRCKAPILTLQPQSQTVVVGDTVNFTTAATGFGTLSYQWQLNGSPLLSATNASLVINNVQPGDQGNYTVTVSNALGTAASSVALLIVLAPQPGVPFVSSIFPLVGAPGTNLTISGFNFSPLAASNIVHFGGVRATVLASGSNSLSVTVPAGALFAPVTVAVGGLSAASSASFTPTFSGDAAPITGSTLAAGQNLPGASGPHRTVIADLDGDGWPDMAVANVYAHTVSLFRNLGQGQPLGTPTFGARVDFPTIGGSTDNPYGLIAADMDADGKLDLVFTDRVNNRVGIYRNIATPGTLTTNSFSAPLYFNTGSDPRYLRVADLDRDGRPDIVTCNLGNGTISILPNTGSAGVLDASTFASRFDLVADVGAYDVAIADLDGDMRLDLAFANQSSFTISLFRNISTPGVLNSASFAPRVNLAANAGATIAAGDLDGDGRPDLITGGNNTAISVYRNLGSTNGFSAGSFAGNVDHFNPGWVHNVVFGDINGDGKLDVVVVGELNSYLRVYQNLSAPGNITLAPGVDYATGWNAWGVSVGDLDLDSRNDIVFANAYDNTVTLYRNIAPLDGPPFFFTQPTNRSVTADSNATFTAGIEGKSPIAYQWFYNGEPLTNSAHIVGATSNILNVIGAQTNDSGAYWLVATNTLGSITSSVATLDVGFAPVITFQSGLETDIANTPTSFVVLATGTPELRYQWRFHGTNLTDSARISGATDQLIVISNITVADAGTYSVTVSNMFGVVTSTPIVLVVVVPPSIVTDPLGGDAPAGTNFTFTVVAAGDPALRYQWRFNQLEIPLATNSSLLVTNVQAANAGDYTVVVTNLYGSVTSAVAVLVVTPSAPVFTLNPANRTATKGAEVTFSATAKGSEPISYQWLLNGTNILGATGSNFAITNAQNSNAGIYSAQATNIAGATNSTDATLTITPPPGFLWTRTAGSTGADSGRSVTRDTQGNILVAGTFTGTIPFGTNVLVSTNASTEIFVAKYDPAGKILWARSGGGAGSDNANGIAEDGAGNVIVVGQLAASGTFEGQAVTNIGGSDAFVAKYDPNGTLLWVMNFGGTSTDIANAVAADASGSIFITGSFNGTGFFGGTIISNTLNGAGFTARLNPDGSVNWVRASSGSGAAAGTGIALDSQTNVLVTGTFAPAFASFDGLTVSNNYLGLAAAFTDVFVVKYNANGSVLWAQRAGGSNSETARGIAVDGGGNSYVVGAFNVSATFGRTTLTEYPGFNQSPEVFLFKCDPYGNILWAQRAGGTSADSGLGVAVDGGGNVFMTGSFSGAANFGGSPVSTPIYPGYDYLGGTNITAAGGADAFVAMYSTAGEFRWVRKAGGVSTDSGNGIATDDRGGLLLTGNYAISASFGHDFATAVGGTDFFLSKLAAFDADAPAALVAQPVNQTNVPAGSTVTFSAGVIAPGPIGYQWLFNGTNLPGATNLSLTLINVLPAKNGAYSVNVTTPNGSLTSTAATLSVVAEPDFLWAKHFGGTGNDEYIAVAADPNGNTYAAGYFSGTADFGATNQTSFGGEDGFVAKFDAAQNLVWLRQIGGTNHDRANALALDNAGNVIVGGHFSATVDFGGTNLTSFGSNDVFLAKFDNAGALLWARKAGNTNSDFARSVAVHTNGDIAVAGQFQLNAVFGEITVTNRNTSGWDIFTARYDADGQLLWVNGAGGNTISNHDDRARGVAFDSSGNVVTCGSYLYGINFGSVSLNNNRAAQEIFIAKYSPTGSVLWARSSTITLQTPQSVDDEAMAVASDRDGNIFLAGYFQNQITMASNTIFAANTNVPDMFLVRYDANGNALWLRTGGGVGTDSALALATDNSGNALLAGSFTGPAQFGGQTLPGIGGADAFAAMFDATGILVKLRKLGGTGDDAAQAVAYDGRGNLVLGGFHTGASVVGETPLPGSGLRDAFVTKLSLYDPDLAPLITTQPLEQTVGYGKILDLGVGVTSGSSPSYQWFFNNAPLSGATNGTVRVTNFQYAAVGDYSVIITNAFGAVTSIVATVAVEIVPEFPWMRRAGGTGDDQALALAMDAQTNLYMAGYFTGTATFTNGFFGTNISLVSTGLTDIFLAKYTSSGQLLWARQAGGNREDVAQSIAIDSDGNVFTTGYFRSLTARFDSIVLTNPSVDFHGEIFVTKYDPQGNVVWARRAGGAQWDVSRCIAVDGAGDAYITGYCYWLATFGNITLTNGSSNFPSPTNYFVAKFSSAGDMLWAKSAVGTSTSQATGQSYGVIQGFGLGLDNSTNVIVTGHFVGTANFGDGNLVNNNSTTEGGSVFLTKYGQSGNLLWAKKGISGAPGIGLAVRAAGDGNLYATSHRTSFSGTPAIALTKYDSNGFPIWTRGVSQGNGQLQPSSLALDADENIFVVGAVSAGTLTYEGLQITTGSGFVSKYRPDGLPLWVTLAGAWCFGVVPDNTGGAYLAGRYTAQGAAFGSSKTNFLAAIGGNDIFLVKIGVKTPTATPQAFVKTIATDAGTTLQVTTTGTGPFAYQWRFNGTNISGATGSTYLLSGVKWTNAGLYSVVVSNTAGSFVSASAAVNVSPKLYSEPSGNDVKLTWDGQFILQSSTNPAGPFADLPGVVSPHFYATSNGPLRFFRLKSEPFALTLSNQPGAGMTLSGAGISGYNFILLGSTNLVSWTPLGTNISPFSFTETNVAPQRFYRAIMAQ